MDLIKGCNGKIEANLEYKCGHKSISLRAPRVLKLPNIEDRLGGHYFRLKTVGALSEIEISQK